MSMAAAAHGQDSACKLARAAAKYAFADNGTVVGVGPRMAVGIFTLDSAGNLNGKATSSLNGTIADETFSGTYARRFIAVSPSLLERRSWFSRPCDQCNQS